MTLTRIVTTPAASDTGHGIAVTSSGTTDVKGAWVELLSATEFDIHFLEVQVSESFASATSTTMVVDIGYDAAAGTAYGVVIPDILAGGSSATGSWASDNMDSGPSGRVFACPVYIPAGSTVAARVAAVIVSDVVNVALNAHGATSSSDPYPTQGLVVAYGITGSSGVNPAQATADTLGAWVEVTGATTHPHRGFSVATQPFGTPMGNDDSLYDIGIGASSSEVILIEKFGVGHQAQEKAGGMSPIAPCIAQPIPEGSRIAVRAKCGTNVRGDDMDYAVYGWG